jgi:hypothetical protein
VGKDNRRGVGLGLDSRFRGNDSVLKVGKDKKCGVGGGVKINTERLRECTPAALYVIKPILLSSLRPIEHQMLEAVTATRRCVHR